MTAPRTDYCGLDRDRAPRDQLWFMVVEPADALTYRFLWERRVVRSFYRSAAMARNTLAGWKPSLLGKLSYVYG